MGGCAGRFLADFPFFEPAFLSSMPRVDSIVEAAITQSSFLAFSEKYVVSVADVDCWSFWDGFVH